MRHMDVTNVLFLNCVRGMIDRPGLLKARSPIIIGIFSVHFLAIRYHR